MSTEISKTNSIVARKIISSKMGLNKILIPKLRVAVMMNHHLTKVVKVRIRAVQVEKKMMMTRMKNNKMRLRNGRTNTAAQA